MAKVSSINVDRVLWCCEDRGIDIPELAGVIKLPPETLTSILRGESNFSISHLKKIAKFFNKGLLFFLEPGPVDENRLRSAGFRTLANDNPDLSPKIKTLIERVEQQRQIFLGLREGSDEAQGQTFDPPQVVRSNPSDAAETIRLWLKIGHDLNFDTYRTSVEKRGVLVFRSNGFAGAWQIPKDSTICGFSIIHRRFPVIFVRKEESEKRQLFTLIHELGHLILHANGFVDELEDLYSYSGKEREANAFAGHLLVPNSFLAEIADTDNPHKANGYESWLNQFSNRWGVSVEVILRRLLDSNRLSHDEYESYRKWKSINIFSNPSGGSRKYRFREPKHMFGDRFVKTVLDALHSRQINITRASSYLDNLKIADIHKLERVYNAF